jgi:hypothetical protein
MGIPITTAHRLAGLLNELSGAVIAYYPTPVSKDDELGVMVIIEMSILNDGTQDVTGNLL